jgi:hypothetical protein
MGFGGQHRCKLWSRSGAHFLSRLSTLPFPTLFHLQQSVYPESWNSSNSANLDTLLTSKLREMALQLRALHQKNLQQMSKRRSLLAAREAKDGMLKEIYRILTITCGTPPKPDEKVRSPSLPCLLRAVSLVPVDF